MLNKVFGFPSRVNDKAARVVAGGVVVMCVAMIASEERWILVPLAYGFWARALTGPKLSPLGQFATRVAAPRLGEPRFVAGPPKRFAQAIGVAFSTAALVLAFGFGETAAASVVVGCLAAAAAVESFLGYCIGCRIFAMLIRAGVVPEEVCEACSDLSLRRPVPRAS